MNDLIQACVDGDLVRVTKYLKEGTFDIHFNDDEALRMASYRNYPDIVELLLDHGANVHVWDDEALMEASSHHQPKLVEILLKAGANPNARKGTPLLWATLMNDIKTLKLLLDAGGDVVLDCLTTASYSRYIDIVKLFLDYGAVKSSLDKSSTLEMREYIPINPRRVRGVIF